MAEEPSAPEEESPTGTQSSGAEPPLPYWKRPALRWGAVLAVLSGGLALTANLSELAGWLAPDETRELVEETRTTVLDTDAKLDELLALLRNQAATAGENLELDLEAEATIRQAIQTIIQSGSREKREALELLAQGDAAGAARSLRRIAQVQDSAVAGIADDVAESWREAGALFYTMNIEASIDAYRQAERLRPRDPQTLVDLGYAQVRAGHLAAAQDSFERSIEIGENLDTLASAWLGLGRISRQRGAYDRADQQLRHALSLVEAEGMQWTRIFARIQLGMLLQAGGELAEAAGLLGRAQAEAEAADLQRLEIMALDGLGVINARRGEHVLAESQLRRALAFHELNNDLASRAHTLGNIGAIYLQQGEGDRAEPLLIQSMEIGRQLGWQASVAYDLVNLAAIDGEQGELDSARERLREAQSIAEQAEMEELLPVILFNRGDLSERAGDREAACRQWQAALPMMDAIGSVYASAARQQIEDVDCPRASDPAAP